MDKQHIADWFETLQATITSGIEAADGKGKFLEDKWSRPGGGGGKTRIMNEGEVLEKAGVGFSAVHGPTPEKIQEAFGMGESEFFATGVSLVFHPRNPMVPIIHMNVRYFEMDNGTCWFGGGIDLTPIYVDPEQASWFHMELKKTCDKHDPTYYQAYKAWCDDYFYLNHRKETRGIGGIFFDHLKPGENNKSKEELFAFVQDIGELFTPTYSHLMKMNKDLSYTEREKNWQLLRRGRYVEFNLVYDRGTKFGLETNGRTESILMSMPPLASWAYDHTPEEGSKEAETLQFLKKGINWQEIAHA